MEERFLRIPEVLALAWAVSLPARLESATNDNDVEWNGVLSLPTWRAPLHPGRDEPFTVRLRVFRGDITRARVRTWDGAEGLHDMHWVRGEGAYEYWEGTVPGAAGDFVYYRFQITDGADTDHYNALGMWADPPPRGDFLVNTTPLGRFPLGAVPDGGGAVFRVWAPSAATAAVAGSFNGWSPAAHRMTPVAGFWQVRIPAAPPRSEYKFVFDGSLWRTDPRSRAQVTSAGNSILWRSDHVWGDGGWVTPYFEDMVVYELHAGSFSGDGDGVLHSPGRFRDVVDAHLEHLVDLGINMVEIMPVGEFARDRSWGYNPAFLFAPESAYGTPDDLKYMVDRLHQAGIGVILDVVYNHMGPSDLAGNLLDYDGQDIYFYPPESGYRETPWGPRLDYGRVEVRELLRDNVRYWLEEFHLDGLRVDATDFIKVNAEGWQLLKDIAQVVDDVSLKAVVIAEQLPNDPAVTRPIAEGGAGLDSQWNDPFHDSLRAAIAAAAFGDPDLGAVAAGMAHPGFPGTRAVNYIESHDEAAHQGRVPVVADSSDPESEWARGRSKVALALVLLTAGIPMLLQGQELLESRPFGDSEDRRVQWRNRERHRDFYQAARDMVHLRRLAPALRSDSPQEIYHVNDAAEVLAFRRWRAPGEDLVVVASLGDSSFPSYCLGLPLSGTWHEVLNTDAAVYGGSGFGNGGRVMAEGGPRDGMAASACIRLPAVGVLVLAREPIPLGLPGFLRGDCNGDGALDLADAVHHLARLFRGTAGDCNASCDTNADGRLDLTDAVRGLSFLFRGGEPPPAPWPFCRGFAAELGCERRCGG